MPREVRNVRASIQARLRDVAVQTGTDVQIVFSRYVLERLLYRLSISPYRDRFIVKGALLFPLWLADPFRPTRDLDLLGLGDPRPEELAKVFRQVMSIHARDDGVLFDIDNLRAEAIRDAADYGGVRVRTAARLGSARIAVQIDIGFGDAVVPPAAEVEFPVLLDAPAPRLHVYAKETVVAEKFEAIVALGGENSRMKDFYDHWAMSRRFDFDGVVLVRAIRATFERRRTEVPTDVPPGLSDAVATSPEKEAQWRAFTARGRLDAQARPFPEVVVAVRKFLTPAARAASDAQEFVAVWDPGGPWRRPQT